MADEATIRLVHQTDGSRWTVTAAKAAEVTEVERAAKAGESKPSAKRGEKVDLPDIGREPISVPSISPVPTTLVGSPPLGSVVSPELIQRDPSTTETEGVEEETLGQPAPLSQPAQIPLLPEGLERPKEEEASALSIAIDKIATAISSPFDSIIKVLGKIGEKKEQAEKPEVITEPEVSGITKEPEVVTPEIV